jgi:hypothetical protein
MRRYSLVAATALAQEKERREAVRTFPGLQHDMILSKNQKSVHKFHTEDVGGWPRARRRWRVRVDRSDVAKDTNYRKVDWFYCNTRSITTDCLFRGFWRRKRKLETAIGCDANVHRGKDRRSCRGAGLRVSGL